MRDYPNMSYCMCENTRAALAQVINAMAEQGPHFVMELSRDEKHHYAKLFDLCELFCAEYEEIQDIIENEEC